MERAYGQARLDDGTVVDGAEVRVYEQGTLTQATIYDDDLSPNPTLKANPFFADTNGQWFFYAANGRYDIVISLGTPPFPVAYTIPDYNLGLGDCGPKKYDFVSELPATPGSIHFPQAHEGRIAYVKQDGGGIWVDTGLDGPGWQPITAFAFPVGPRDSFPGAGLPGRLRIANDNVRGIWQDSGSYWFNIFGEVVNIQDFGAVGDGSTDDTAAIQAAIDALAATGGGGRVLIPARTFGVKAPLLLRNGTILQGTSPVGSVLAALSTFAGDSMLRGFSRDDNTPSNFEAVGVVDLALQGPASSPAAFACIDMTGWHRSRISNVVAIGPGTGVPNLTALRVADINPAGSSVKDCLDNRIESFDALRWNTFLRVREVSQVEDITLTQFATTCRKGIVFEGYAGSGISFSIGSGLLYGDGVSDGTAFAMQGIIPPFTVIDRIGVQLPFGDGDGVLTDFRNSLFLNHALGVGRSGTGEFAAVPPFGAAPGPFTGSVFVKIPAGTALLQGRNLFTYTVPGMGAILPTTASPVVACQGFIFPTLGGFGAANSGDTLTLVVVSTAPAVLIADTVFRVFMLL